MTTLAEQRTEAAHALHEIFQARKMAPKDQMAVIATYIVSMSKALAETPPVCEPQKVLELLRLKLLLDIDEIHEHLVTVAAATNKETST